MSTNNSKTENNQHLHNPLKCEKHRQKWKNSKMMYLYRRTNALKIVDQVAKASQEQCSRITKEVQYQHYHLNMTLEDLITTFEV